MVSKKSQKRKVVSRKTTKKRPLMKKKPVRKMSKKRRVVKKKRSSRKKSKKHRVVKKKSSRKKTKKVIMRGGKEPLKSEIIEQYIEDNFIEKNLPLYSNIYNLETLEKHILYHEQIVQDTKFKKNAVLGIVTLLAPKKKEVTKFVNKYRKKKVLDDNHLYNNRYFIIVKNHKGQNIKYEILYNSNNFWILDSQGYYFDTTTSKFINKTVIGSVGLIGLESLINMLVQYVIMNILYSLDPPSLLLNNIKYHSNLYKLLNESVIMNYKILNDVDIEEMSVDGSTILQLMIKRDNTEIYFLNDNNEQITITIENIKILKNGNDKITITTSSGKTYNFEKQGLSDELEEFIKNFKFKIVKDVKIKLPGGTELSTKLMVQKDNLKIHFMNREEQITIKASKVIEYTINEEGSTINITTSEIRGPEEKYIFIKTNLESDLKEFEKEVDKAILYARVNKKSFSTRAEEAEDEEENNEENRLMMATATEISNKKYVVIFDFDECLMKGSWTEMWRLLKNKDTCPNPGSGTHEFTNLSGSSKNLNTDFGFVTEKTVDKEKEVRDFFYELNEKAYIYIASYGYYDCIETVLKKVLGDSFVDDYIKILTPELYKKPGTNTFHEGGTDLGDNKNKILTDILSDMDDMGKMKDIKKENCVFFDDNIKNVETANKLDIIGRQDAPFSNERKEELLTLINKNENLDSLSLY